MKIVIWGYKLNKTRHTQSYIFYGFDKAFKELGYKTLWLDNDDDVSGINFDDTIFFTEGQVERNIPIVKSAKYILHNCNENKYFNLSHVNIQIYHDYISSNEIINQHPTFTTKNSITRINKYTCVANNTIYQPWATDLLPREIILENATNQLSDKTCVWVGSYGDRITEYQNTIELDLFFNECRKNNIQVNIINPWVNPIYVHEHIKLINKAFLAPSIQGPWQIKYGYAPQCRILKNISYGHLGITNNKALNDLFDNKLIFDNDIINLFYKCIDKKMSPNAIDEIKYLMNEVRTKHTFINRANVILGVLNGYSV